MITQALLIVLAAQPAELRLMRNPDIHGDQIVFQYAADLWSMNRSEGVARRLTTYEGVESSPRFSPDGKWIAFTGSYDGNNDIYVMPSEGGEPKRLTFNGETDTVLDWTPDGKIAYRSTAQSQYFTMPGLWIVDPKGGLPKRTPISEISDGAVSPDGKTVAYNRAGSHNFNWRRYRGGTQGRIGFFDMDKMTYSEIPSGRENRWQPVWAGDNIYYISDKDFGTRNLFSFDTKVKRERRLTEFKDADIRNPGGDSKTIVFERDGFLYAFDIASGKAEKVSARAVNDFPATRPRFRNVGQSISSFSLSPTGVRIVAEARGDIYSIPVRDGDVVNLTDSQGVRESSPMYSPDGQSILYLSDQGGDQGIYMMPQKGGGAKQLKKNPKHFIRGWEWMPDSKSFVYITNDGGLYHYNIEKNAAELIHQNTWQSFPTFDISADGSWIAFTGVNDNLQRSLYLYDVEEKKSAKVTEGYFDDEQVSFDMTGKYLYFVSTRTFIPDFGFEIMLDFAPGSRVYALPLRADMTNPFIKSDDTYEPEPKKDAPPAAAPPSDEKPAEAPKKNKLNIDLDNLASRAIPLPWGPGSYPAIIGTANGVATLANGEIQWFSMDSQQSIPVYQGPVFGISLNQKRTKLAIRTPQGILVQDARPGAQPTRVETSDLTMMWDPRAEWRQILREAWRWQRDVYYDPNLLGLDWDAIWKQYEPQLEHVRHRADLNYLIGMMIGELGTGHAYVQGGEFGNTGQFVSIGALGADYEVEGRAIKFKKIYRGFNFDESMRGPLGEPGLNVKEGDYLLSIDGKPVDTSNDLHQHLVNKVGKNVRLRINNRPNATGAREIVVRPIPSEQNLRYMTWVEDNRKKVEAATNGKVGYLHVPDTAVGGMIGFIRGFYSQVDKEAWIIDERFNGGGFIPTFFIEFMNREVQAKMKNRNFKDISFPTGLMDGPKVMLINEYAGSGGDMLPWLFRESKLGPLIGKRTWGGLVGIQGGVNLVDGGNVTSPGFGIYDPYKGEWIAENTGVDPDIDVDARPDLIAKGQDPQLDRALVEIKKLMEKNPPKRFKTPAFPKPVVK